MVSESCPKLNRANRLANPQMSNPYCEPQKNSQKVTRKYSKGVEPRLNFVQREVLDESVPH